MAVGLRFVRGFGAEMGWPSNSVLPRFHGLGPLTLAGKTHRKTGKREGRHVRHPNVDAATKLAALRNVLEGPFGRKVTELDKPKSNGLKLTSRLSAVGNTVQTLAAAPQAYQVLKTALVPFGIMLP